uniref:Uncharacterized protein n=1 Tax=Arundo donax TaxID=35708 RepID=A0A0A9BXQ8_ARUDO
MNLHQCITNHKDSGSLAATASNRGYN